MNLLPTPLMGDQIRQKGDEFGGRVPLGCTPYELPVISNSRQMGGEMLAIHAGSLNRFNRTSSLSLRRCRYIVEVWRTINEKRHEGHA